MHALHNYRYIVPSFIGSTVLVEVNIRDLMDTNDILRITTASLNDTCSIHVQYYSMLLSERGVRSAWSETWQNRNTSTLKWNLTMQ